MEKSALFFHLPRNGRDERDSIEFLSGPEARLFDFTLTRTTAAAPLTRTTGAAEGACKIESVAGPYGASSSVVVLFET